MTRPDDGCDRALAAEDDLTALRKALREYCRRLADPRTGNVIHCRTVVADLEKILDG